MKRYFLRALAASVAALVCCGSVDAQNRPRDVEEVFRVEDLRALMDARARREEPRRAEPRDYLRRDFKSEAFAEEQLAFALNLYRRTLEGDDADANALIAPFSVARCLTALSFGSAGKTKAEIDAALFRSDWDDERWSSEFGAADAALNDAPEATLAGALWFAPDLRLREAFVERCEQLAQTETAAFDFEAPNALQKVNAWFEKNTDGKIKDFLKELDPGTRLLIADATAFKAEWENKFEASSTRPDEFTNIRGEKVLVPTMSQRAEFWYCGGDDFQYLEAPYEGGRFSFVLVLPQNPERGRDERSPRDEPIAESFASLERSLTPEFLLKCHRTARLTEVVFSLPKFKVEKSFDLGETLRKAGVVSAFGNDADFTPTTDDERLKVDQARQAALLSVDENGAEAAAATAFVVAEGSPAGYTPPPRVDADRPFFYFLRENATGAVLFAGRLVDPEPSPEPITKKAEEPKAKTEEKTEAPERFPRFPLSEL